MRRWVSWAGVFFFAILGWVACHFLFSFLLHPLVLGICAGFRLSEHSTYWALVVEGHLIVLARYAGAVLAGALLPGFAGRRARGRAAVVVSLVFLGARVLMGISAFLVVFRFSPSLVLYLQHSWTLGIANFLVGTVAAGVGALLGVLGVLSRKERTFAPEVGPYDLDQEYVPVADSVQEAEPATYTLMGTSFPDERIYVGEKVSCFGGSWATTLAVTQGRIYKITLSAGPDARGVSTQYYRARGSLVDAFGPATRRDELSEALCWEEAWGSVSLDRRGVGQLEVVYIIITSATPFASRMRRAEATRGVRRGEA